MPIFQSDMSKARAVAAKTEAERKAKRSEHAAAHARAQAEAERLRAEFAQAYFGKNTEVTMFLCQRGHQP